MMSRLTRLVLYLNGAQLLFAGVSLIFLPSWFFATFAPFEPFNRHFMGDAGTFALPWGLAFLLVARDPAKHFTLFSLATLASALHALNHLLGDILIERLPLTTSLTDNVSIWLFTLPLIVVYGWQWRQTRRA